MVYDQGILKYKNRICVPKALIPELLAEAHNSRLTIHLGSNKMYQDLRKDYWWEGMKRDVAEFVKRCLVC